MTTPVVEVAGLRKAYGELLAVDGIDLVVEPRQVFGLVGPNGAGKTTTVECVEGLRRPDAGRVRVLGRDPVAGRIEVFRRVGVQLQESSMYTRIRAGEAVRLFASLYPDPLPADELLAEFGLSERAGVYYGALSGGQKRKLLTAVALVGRPELVILDEPTSGLDPQSRQGFWSALGRHRARGLAVLMTTHDLREAEEHCDRVAILDRGRVVAEGTPETLVLDQRLGQRVAARLPGDGFEPRSLAGLGGVTRVEVLDDRVVVFGDGDGFAEAVGRRLREAGAAALASRPANLEDVYLAVTGRGYRPEGDAGAGEAAR